jgi:hypothetical protein
MENAKFELWKRRKHYHTRADQTRTIQLGNGQLLITIPKMIANWKQIGKGSLVRWSDGGLNRIQISGFYDGTGGI